MKALSIFVTLALLLGGCAPAPAPALEPVSSPTAQPKAQVTSIPPIGAAIVPVVTPEVQPTSLYTTTTTLGYVDTWVVDAWVDNPAPPLGEKIIVRAHLLKNGCRIGGVQMRAVWMQGAELQACDILPIYLSGCIIHVRDVTPGAYVPITMTMRYQGMVFTEYTGFTPQ